MSQQTTQGPWYTDAMGRDIDLSAFRTLAALRTALGTPAGEDLWLTDEMGRDVDAATLFAR